MEEVGMNTESTKEFYLPQFKGKSNPYDTLWYLSIEIGRSLLFKAERLGSGIGESTDALMEQYNKIYKQVEELNENERDFLLKDSYFNKCDFYNDENVKIMQLENESASVMSYSSQLVSKDFLLATMGKTLGQQEWDRRCNLVEVGSRYTIDFLRNVIEYIDGTGKINDGIQTFLDHFATEPSIEDIQLMIDVKNTSVFRFYTDRK